MPEDFHDWDVASAPSLFTTRAGYHVFAATPKDGQLYVHDLDSGKRLYVTPVTRREHVDVPLSGKPVHFCPEARGAAVEWNGPAYDPDTNLIISGTGDWCTTVTVLDPGKPASVSLGQPWTGSGDGNLFGKHDPEWGGFISTDH